MTVPGESTAPSKLYVFYLQHQLRESVKGSMRRNKANIKYLTKILINSPAIFSGTSSTKSTKY